MESHENIKKFYDSVYYKESSHVVKTTAHYRKLAKFLGVDSNSRVLDVACGVGDWLLACDELGASVSGIDLSELAIDICKKNFRKGDFCAGPAEVLPFADSSFDVVTCLGSLEHFLDPVSAIKEMVRVAAPNAKFVILVPNADFLTRKLGLYAGTNQKNIKEDVRTIGEWEEIFQLGGLEVTKKWRDLHMLNWNWIARGGVLASIFRSIQVVMLVIWPLKWQYQIYHLLRAKIKST